MFEKCFKCKYEKFGGNEYPCRECINCEMFEPKNSVIENCTENVNHPKHYGREGAMECIDEMLLIFGAEAVKHFCLLNAWKYRYRSADKNGEEDLKKSDWYLKKFADLCGVDE